MIKVCHVTSAHHALDDRIFWKECNSLAGRGYQVFLAAFGDAQVLNHVTIAGIGKPPESRIK